MSALHDELHSTMGCFPEWIYSVYVDDELALAEKRSVESHLIGCQACRERIVALREEAGLIGDALHEREPAALRPKAAAPVRGLALGGFPTLAAIAVASAVAGSILETRLPSYAEWLNPRRLLGAYDMAFDVAFWIRDEVPGLLEFAMAAAALGSVAALLSFAVSALSRRWLGTAGMLAAVLLALSLPFSARALVVLHDHESFLVESGQVLNDTIVVSAETVRIDGVVDGDLFVMAERLIVRGEIRGNLFAGARSIELAGSVRGSMYGFSKRIHVRGEVDKNILTGADQYTLDESARIGGDAVHFGESVAIQGSVARDLYGFAEWIELGGRVERNVDAFAEHVTLLGSAVIGGDLHTRLPRGKEAQISPTATIGGEAKSEHIVHDRDRRFMTRAFWIVIVLHIAAAFALGAVLRLILPTILHSELATSGDFFRALGIGFLALVATPIALCCIAVTLAGIPLALIGFGVYVSALYIATIVVAAVIGRSLLRSRDEPDDRAIGGGSLASLLLGIVIVVATAHLPFVGPLFGIVIILTGLGLLVQHAQASWRLSHA